MVGNGISKDLQSRFRPQFLCPILLHICFVHSHSDYSDLPIEISSQRIRNWYPRRNSQCLLLDSPPIRWQSPLNHLGKIIHGLRGPYLCYLIPCLHNRPPFLAPFLAKNLSWGRPGSFFDRLFHFYCQYNPPGSTGPKLQLFFFIKQSLLGLRPFLRNVAGQPFRLPGDVPGLYRVIFGFVVDGDETKQTNHSDEKSISKERILSEPCSPPFLLCGIYPLRYLGNPGRILPPLCPDARGFESWNFLYILSGDNLFGPCFFCKDGR